MTLFFYVSVPINYTVFKHWCNLIWRFDGSIKSSGLFVKVVLAVGVKLWYIGYMWFYLVIDLCPTVSLYMRAEVHSSEVERLVYARDVVGSIPTGPNCFSSY